MSYLHSQDPVIIHRFVSLYLSLSLSLSLSGNRNSLTLGINNQPINHESQRFEGTQFVSIDITHTLH